MSAQSDDIDSFFTTARISGHDEVIELPGGNYRDYLFDLDDPTLTPWRGMSYEQFTAARQEERFLRELLDFWDSLYAEPFVGVTSDGTVQNVWRLEPVASGGVSGAGGGIVAAGDGIASEESISSGVAAETVQALLDALTPAERERITHPIDSPDWRGWCNPEFVFHRNGLRLEDLSDRQVELVQAVMRATLSAEGYARLDEAMQLNGYLGELTDLPTIMNARSYWFSLFRAPVSSEAGSEGGEAPWGWQLFGHHAAVNYVSVGGRDVVAPVFIGGEPALSDARPPLFAAREALVLELAASFTQEQREEAVVYASVLDPAMPEGRVHPADERHLAGAFRDNRVIPYEGVRVSTFSSSQRSLLRRIVEDFHLLLRPEQREATLADYDRHVDDTWFSWYGATDGTGPFYFRVQSPVIVAELDHHAGVWLNNRLPARFHVHTTLRLPNGNDYGKAYLAQWQAAHGG